MNEQEFAINETEVPSSGLRLRGWVARPASTPIARLMIVHGYGEHAARYTPFMRWLAARGVASATLDQRGHGRSPGRRGYIRCWDEYLDDLKALLQSRDLPGDAPLFVMGHSHGGLITVAAAERGILTAAGVTGVILSSPYFATRLHTPGWKLLLARAAHHLHPGLQVPTGLRSDQITSDPEMAAEDNADPLINHCATPRWYFTMLQTQARVMQDAALFRLPLLCMIGQADVVADPATAEEFCRRAGSADKTFGVYPDRVHELLREVGREEVFEDVLKWINARVV